MVAFDQCDEATIFGLKMMVKSGLEFFILKSYVPLQSCCCPVQKNLPIMAELAWQVSRVLFIYPAQYGVQILACCRKFSSGGSFICAVCV
jgi:hypothetical protein